MNVVVLEKIEMTDEQKKILNKLGKVEIYNNSTLKQSIKRVKDAEIVIIDWIDPNGFLKYMKKGSLLALMSTGYNWIDIKKARSLSVSIANIPGYAGEAVAEHLFGLILAVLRKITIGDKVIKGGGWQKKQVQGFELKNKILGIIGLGKIGLRMAEIGRCFGMEIISYDPALKNLAHIKQVNLSKLLKESDVISINCDLNETSRNLIGKKELNLLKPTAIIVSATWDIIILQDLIKVLKNKKIFGAGLDVAIEGKKANLPKNILKLDNIVLTPHIAYFTEESQIRRVDILLKNIKSFIRKNPKNIIN